MIKTECEDIADLAKDISGRTGARITITEDPVHAVAGSGFIHTDVWVSMGEAKDVWAEQVRLPSGGTGRVHPSRVMP